MDKMLRDQPERIDANGDGEIDGDEIVAFVLDFAQQQVELAEERARRELAESEAKATRTRLKYAGVLIFILITLFGLSTVEPRRFSKSS